MKKRRITEKYSSNLICKNNTTIKQLIDKYYEEGIT